MEQIKAHIAVSLDGHTATPDYELDWLPDKVKAIIGKYYLDADCLLMGANTYNYIFEHWGGWPHKSKRSFVVSHYDTNVTPDCGVEFLTEEPLQRVYELKQKTDILVVGGGKLLTSLIKAGLLDSLTIYTVPVMAGKGIGFIGETFGSHWKLSESRKTRQRDPYHFQGKTIAGTCSTGSEKSRANCRMGTPSSGDRKRD